MLCMPFGGDQDYNARRVEDLQVGRKLRVDDLTANSLVAMLHDVIENPL